MARYVSTTVQCEECGEVVVVDFFSSDMVDDALEELGWNVETGNDVCPECVKKIMDKLEKVEQPNG